MLKILHFVGELFLFLLTGFGVPALVVLFIAGLEKLGKTLLRKVIDVQSD